MLELIADGLIPEKGWRLPEAEDVEPIPEPDERVLLITHVHRGFSIPPCPFFYNFLNYFGAQLHHLPPNAVVYLSVNVSLCENFIGCHPHWALFKHIFSCRSQTMKKSSPDEERTNVIQLCGGLVIQLKGKGSFLTISFPDTVKMWQNTWFYYKDGPSTGS